TVLLIEDASDDAFMVQLSFEKSQITHSIFAVSDAQQAIDYLKGSGPYADRQRFPMPRLVLLDLSLPGTTGFEFLEWLRSDSELKSLPVVVLSGSLNAGDVARAYQLGANSFLEKTADTTRFRVELKQSTDFWIGK
ncbi:MAG: response regulator, partial [Limisphaerales bacterium]